MTTTYNYQVIHANDDVDDWEFLSKEVVSLKRELRRVSAHNKSLELKIAKNEYTAALAPFGTSTPTSPSLSAPGRKSTHRSRVESSPCLGKPLRVRRDSSASAGHPELTRSVAKIDLLQPSPMTQKTSMSASSSDAGSDLSRSHGTRIPRYSTVGLNRALAATEHDVSRSPRADDGVFDNYPDPFPASPLTSYSSGALQEDSEEDTFAIPELPRPPSSTTRPRSALSSHVRKSSIPTPSPRSTRTTAHDTAPSSRGRGGVFFGNDSAAAARHEKRIASAASGTGKVLSDLQVDLATVRGALETTKNQLRNAQRAVEYLSRQNSDLSDGKERLRLENENLSKMVARKERMLEEVLARARTAEATVEAQNKASAESKARMKELEARDAALEARTKRAEGEYAALRSGVDGIVDGCQRDIKAIQDDLKAVVDRHTGDLARAAEERETLETALRKRSDADKELKSLLSQREAQLQHFQDLWREQAADFRARIDAEGQLNAHSNKLAADVDLELKRFRRLMQENGDA